MLIRWLGPKNGKMRRREIKCFGGKNIQKIGCSAKSRSPKRGGNASLEQEGANDIVCGADNAFSFTVLRRGVGAGHA